MDSAYFMQKLNPWMTDLKHFVWLKKWKWKIRELVRGWRCVLVYNPNLHVRLFTGLQWQKKRKWAWQEWGCVHTSFSHFSSCPWKLYCPMSETISVHAFTPENLCNMSIHAHWACMCWCKQEAGCLHLVKCRKAKVTACQLQAKTTSTETLLIWNLLSLLS